MDTKTPTLPLGYFDLPEGAIATIVTCLAMAEKPAPRPSPAPAGLVLERWETPDIEGYRALYRRIGEEWLWMSRLVMDDDALKAILETPEVEVYALTENGERIGLLELDFREAGQCELAFFGVASESVGTGIGRYLMNAAIEIAWSRAITRFWVHTCHLDHPAALGFYQRSGFTPFKRMVEVFADPRLSGTLSRNAGRHMPLIDR